MLRLIHLQRQIRQHRRYNLGQGSLQNQQNQNQQQNQNLNQIIEENNDDNEENIINNENMIEDNDFEINIIEDKKNDNLRDYLKISQQNQKKNDDKLIEKELKEFKQNLIKDKEKKRQQELDKKMGPESLEKMKEDAKKNFRIDLYESIEDEEEKKETIIEATKKYMLQNNIIDVTKIPELQNYIEPYNLKEITGKKFDYDDPTYRNKLINSIINFATALNKPEKRNVLKTHDTYTLIRIFHKLNREIKDIRKQERSSKSKSNQKRELIEDFNMTEIYEEDDQKKINPTIQKQTRNLPGQIWNITKKGYNIGKKIYDVGKTIYGAYRLTNQVINYFNRPRPIPEPDIMHDLGLV